MPRHAIRCRESLQTGNYPHSARICADHIAAFPSTRSRALTITSNRDFDEWPLVFANPLMASATMGQLVHRTVKIVIKGKSYRMDSFVPRSRELPQPSGRIPPRPAEGPYRPSSRDPRAILLPAPGRSVARSSQTPAITAKVPATNSDRRYG